MQKYKGKAASPLTKEGMQMKRNGRISSGRISGRAE